MTRRSKRDERGSNLVEAAIILPVIVLLTFGAIDFGIGFNEKAGLDNAGRSGARRAATDTITDNAAPTPDPPNGTIPQNTQIGFDAGSAVNAALSQTEAKPELVDLYVFRSVFNGSNWLPASVTSPGECSAATYCIHYFAKVSNGGQFNLYSGASDGSPAPVGTWPATAPNYPERNACSVDADRVGITIRANYRFLSGLVGQTVVLTSTSASQLEPINC